MENNKIEAMTASELLLKHDLNWKIVRKDAVVDGKIAKDFKAIVREDTGEIFQFAKNRYFPWQNSDLTSSFDELVQSAGAKYTAARSYKGGRIVEIEARLPHDFEVLPGDVIETYVRMITSHDGSMKTRIVPGMRVQWCSNGATRDEDNNAKLVAVKHTSGAEGRFKLKAKELLADEIVYFQKAAADFRRLAAREMTQIEVDDFLIRLFDADDKEEISTRKENQIGEVKELIRVGTWARRSGQKLNTAWAAFNGVTEYIDKFKSTKGDDEGGTENRDYSAIFGTGKKMREKAYELLSV